tara:strand:- start:567 stop:875 length:309 start_codon:yes stop_codon:yes gene_type:complete
MIIFIFIVLVILCLFLNYAKGKFEGYLNHKASEFYIKHWEEKYNNQEWESNWDDKTLEHLVYSDLAKDKECRYLIVAMEQAEKYLNWATCCLLLTTISTFFV